ncbi:hypothetical protein GCM10022224_015960 [Nonomuraea antimicrobica]|uniref:Uncharacterized protein n=1 Tax=Nonomuraea antimicrobica TaxID=561173 RepID=A0ABP7BAU5_9ACTN
MAYPPQPPQPHQSAPRGGAQGAPQGYGSPQPYGPPPHHPAPNAYGPPQPSAQPPPDQGGQPGPQQPNYGWTPSPHPPQPGHGRQPDPQHQPGHGQATDPWQQGYGQTPGPHQQPGHGQTPGPQHQPGHGQAPGPHQQPGYGGGPYQQSPQGGPFPPAGYAPRPPAKSNTALIIGLAVGLAVLLLGGGGVGVYLYLSSAGGSTPIAQPADTRAPSSGRPSDDPTPDDPTPDTSASDDPTPAQPTSEPDSSSNQAQPGSPLTDEEFDDWDFALGGVKFQANKVAGWTYNSCTPVDGQGLLAKNDCQRAIQLAYSAYSGHLKAVQIMMSFPSDKAAKTTADRLAKLSSDAVRWRQDKAHTKYVYGKILSSASKKYVVVTIVTADKSADSMAPNFHAYLQTDHASYFLLRDQTITS